MTEKWLSEEKVMTKLEELALKPTLTEDEQRQMELLLKASKATAERWIAETDRMRIESDKRMNLRKMQMEEKLKRRELEENEKNRKWNIGLEVFKMSLSLAVTCCLFGAGLSFETTSAWTSRTAQTIKNLLTLVR